MTRAKTRNKTDELLDELLEGCESPEDIFGKHGLVTRLTKRLIERALRAELTEHLGYAPHAPEGRGSGNARNGSSAKTVQTAYGDLPLEVPRDRQGSFEPILVPKRQRQLEPKIRDGFCLQDAFSGSYVFHPLEKSPGQCICWIREYLPGISWRQREGVKLSV